MITSISNERIKKVRKLRERKVRDETLLAYIEGIRIVIEAIQHDAEIEQIIVAESFENAAKRKEIKDLIQNSGAEIVLVTDQVFKSLSQKDGPQGVSAVVRQSWTAISTINKKLTGLWVCLWEVADPGNLGTILRTMDGSGAKGLILSGNCTDPYDPGAVRASMGAIFSQSLVRASLDETLELIDNKKVTVIGTSDSAALYYRDIQYPQNMVLIMGSERQGIPVELSRKCSNLVKIPMEGTCDSLNLSVATGILLYEIHHQKLIKVDKNDRIP